MVLRCTTPGDTSSYPASGYTNTGLHFPYFHGEQSHDWNPVGATSPTEDPVSVPFRKVNSLLLQENQNVSNTLGKEVTRHFFKNEDGYTELQARWKELTDQIGQPRDVGRPLSLYAPDYLLYAILRGKDYRKGFTPAKNPKLIACQLNGNPDLNLEKAMGNLRYYLKRGPSVLDSPSSNPLKPFGDLLSTEAWSLLLQLLPEEGATRSGYREILSLEVQEVALAAG
jgi:hypothetical protein